MRLADKIIARAVTPASHPMDRDWKAWETGVRSAACYEIERSVGTLAFETINTSPARAMQRTLAATAFPQRTCWFEWLGPSASMGPYADEEPRPGSIVPSRCGVLVQCRDGDHRTGVMSFAWSLPGHDLEACPFSVTFDWRVTKQPVPDIRRAAFELMGQSWVDAVRDTHTRSRHASQPFEELLAVEERFGHVPCGMLEALWTRLTAKAILDPEFATDIVQNSLRDLEGEPTFVLAVLICMCAKGFVEVGELDDFKRLNQARAKQRKPALLPFRKLSASGANVIRLSDRGGALETMQAVHAA